VCSSDLDLFETKIKHLLIPQDVVMAFHTELVNYLQEDNPIFIIRYVNDQTRGEILKGRYGLQIKPSDNAPAWWIHSQLFNNGYIYGKALNSMLEEIPMHMFSVTCKTVNNAGWHVAHIFDVKDGNTDWQAWDRDELRKRMVRNIHPCNYFFLPLGDWQKYGSDKLVINYFYHKFSEIYGVIWNDFLEIADGGMQFIPPVQTPIPYSYLKKFSAKNSLSNSAKPDPISRDGCVVTYEYYRLGFKADLIEPLHPNDKFCIITKEGTFVMSKKEFYEAFANVIKSKSYKDSRLYHYKSVPKQALKFRVGP
jgi:hypothetical protein